MCCTLSLLDNKGAARCRHFPSSCGCRSSIVEDYTSGEDFVRGRLEVASLSLIRGLSYGAGNEQMLLLLNINDASQVNLIRRQQAVDKPETVKARLRALQDPKGKSRVR